VRTIQTALGARRTKEAGEKSPVTLPTLSAHPRHFPTEEDVRELAEALADPKVATMILPHGATVGVETNADS
jgi:hypothetical protein